MTGKPKLHINELSRQGDRVQLSVDFYLDTDAENPGFFKAEHGGFVGRARKKGLAAKFLFEKLGEAFAEPGRTDLWDE